MKKWMLRFFAVMAIAIGGVVGPNLFDAKLNPDVASVLRDVRADENSQAYEYLLGILAPQDQDPATVGKGVHESRLAYAQGKVRLKDLKLPPAEPVALNRAALCPDLCANDDFAHKKPALEKIVADNERLIRRFDRWIRFGALNADHTQVLLRHTPNILDLYSLKFAQLNLLLREKKEKQVLDQLLAMGDFSAKSIDRQHTFVFASVMIAATQRVRTFTEKAAKESIGFSKILTAKQRRRFEYPIDPARSLKAATDSEISSMPTFFREINEDWTAQAGLRPAGKLFVSIFFHPHRTLNEVAARLQQSRAEDCVASDQNCPELPLPERSLVNPYGRGLARMVAIQPKSFQSLYKRLAKLNVPLEL